jgi:formiminotetrahydrofolate cyclodeaminase
MCHHPGLVDVFTALDPVLDGIGSREPAPGGGSTAAVVGAMAAALCTKAARFSDDPGAAAQAEHLRRRLTGLAREDAEVFVRALRDLDEPRDPDPDRRDWQLGRSLAAAADVPLRIAEACADVAELAADLARRGKPELQPDAAGAAVLAEAAARVCAHLVAVNLGATAEDARVRHVESLAAAAGQAVERAGA